MILAEPRDASPADPGDAYLSRAPGLDMSRLEHALAPRATTWDRPYRAVARCAACRAPYPVVVGPRGGRPPRYCRFDRSSRVRVRLWRARRRVSLPPRRNA